MKWLLFLLLLLPVFTQAQDIKLPVDSAAHQIDYTEVVQVKNTPKEVLYDRAREWFARYYTSAESDVRLDDFETGKIIVKSFVPVSKSGNYYHLQYTLTLSLKANYYRYELSDFTYQDGEYDDKKSISDLYLNPDDLRENGTHKGANKGLYEKVDATANAVAKSLKNALEKGYK